MDFCGTGRGDSPNVGVRSSEQDGQWQRQVFQILSDTCQHHNHQSQGWNAELTLTELLLVIDVTQMFNYRDLIWVKCPSIHSYICNSSIPHPFAHPFTYLSTHPCTKSFIYPTIHPCMHPIHSFLFFFWDRIWDSWAWPWTPDTISSVPQTPELQVWNTTPVLIFFFNQMNLHPLQTFSYDLPLQRLK